jgi:hypothetical protein
MCCFFTYEQVLNSVRLLTRLMPYIFEDPDWRNFFWSAIPDSAGSGGAGPVGGGGGHPAEGDVKEQSLPLAQVIPQRGEIPRTMENHIVFPDFVQVLLNAVSDLLFCPEFTVAPSGGSTKGKSTVATDRDEADDLQTLDSCEYIWASGVGFARFSPIKHISTFEQKICSIFITVT